jgi:hypothetical protein
MRFTLSRVSMVLALIPLLAVSAFAQATTTTQGKPAAKVSGFLDVNFGVVFPAKDTFTSSDSYVSYGQTSSWSFEYTVPTMKGIDVAGGALFTPSLGFGIAVSSVGSEAAPKITDTEPNLYWHNDSATDTLVGDTLSKRRETSVHLSFVFKPTAPSSKLQLRIYGGPTYFNVSQDLVSGFWYTETSSYVSIGHTLTITRYEETKATDSAWGFHAGGDFGYFFTKNIGLGGGVRYSWATVRFPDTAKNLGSADDHTQDLSVGGLSLVFGLRVKF